MSTSGGLPPDLSDLVQVPKFLGSRSGRACPVVGSTPGGIAVRHLLTETWTLLVFLSTSCQGCHDLWDAVSGRNGPAFAEGIRTVVVTRGPGQEDTGAVALLAGNVTVVMSDDAWTDYEVHGGPFFVLVDGDSGRIATEGVAWSIEQIGAAITAAGAGG